MKKFTKKILVALCTMVAVAAMSVSLAACAGGSSAELTGTYTSSTFTFQSMYPTITFKLLTNSVQTLKTYDDGTYEFTVASTSLSGGLSFDPTNSGDQNGDAISRGQVVKIYYGSYTAVEEEGLLTVTLSAPTKYVYNSVGGIAGYNGYLNTDAWTDTMAEAVAVDGVSQTAEQYLATVAFGETAITVDLATYGFNYVTLA